MNPSRTSRGPRRAFTPRWRQAFWNARTPMSSVRSTMTDWSRNSYSTKSRGSRDLLEPARHLPDPGPQLLGLQRVEVRVEVALLGYPVRELHRVGHREGHSIRDRHALRPLGVAWSDRRLTGRYKTARGPDGNPSKPRPADVDVLVVGAGITGIYQLYRAREAGFSAQLLEAGGGVGRHLVLEPLPGRPVRLRELHVRLPLLEGAVRRVGVAGALRRRSPRPSATSTTSSTGSTSGATCGSTPRSRRRSATSRRAPGRSTARRRHARSAARFLVAATGVLSVPYFPDVPGRDDFRGEAHHTGPVAGGAGRLRRQARRGHRHGVERRAGGPDDPRRGRVAHRVPAHRQLVHAAQQPADHRRGAGAAPGRLRGAARDAEHVAQRVRPPGERPRARSTTPRRSGGRSSRRCGAARAS